MKIVMSVARFLFIICLPCLLLTAAIAGAVNSSWLYTHGFEKFNVRQSLADNGYYLTQADMSNIARGFIRYWDSNEQYISLTVQQQGVSVALFNKDEILHFRDVKNLFRFDYAVLLGTFLYCLIFGLVSIYWDKLRNRRKLAVATIWSGAITLILMLLLGIGTILNFDKLFLYFHQLVFTNNFWSVKGNMLLLFPDGFWYDTMTCLLISIAAATLILVGLSWYYLERHKEKNPLLKP
jgi:integral membrane protein (TIGR01906 family)